MGRRIGNNKITEEKSEPLRLYMYSLIDKDVLPWNIPKIRENLKNYEDNERVRKYDRWLIEELDEILKLNPAIKDDNSQPIKKWWWHLHKIAQKTYPKNLLPDYLQDIYEGSK